MELNNEQVELCLQHALGQFLADWEGTAQEAWQRLLDLHAQTPGMWFMDEDADVTVAEEYQAYSLADLVSRIDAALLASQQLAQGMLFPVITIEVQGGRVTDVSGLPDGYTYEVNDLD